jgi:transposase
MERNMARKSKAISNDLLRRCKLALKRQGKQGETGRRLQAIISAKEHGITKVAEVYGITRMTLMKWIKSFSEEAELGFIVKQGRGRKRILGSVDEEAIHKIISSDYNITIKQLRAEIEKKLKIKASRSTLYRVMHRLGFAYITPRAQHHKKNPKLAEDFKKKS